MNPESGLNCDMARCEKILVAENFSLALGEKSLLLCALSKTHP